MTAAELADRLQARRSGNRWQAKCPAHEDRQASLSIAEGADGRTLIHCFAGCDPAAVMEAMGLALADLALARTSPNGPAPNPASAQTRYVIRDSKGEPLAVHVRFDTLGGKRVWWELPDGSKGLGPLSVGILLYGLELLPQHQGAKVILTEGEKAADALRARRPEVVLGTVCGASEIPDLAVLETLRGREVLLWADNDRVGRRHMDRIAPILRGIGCEVRMIEWAGAPPKGDAADCPPELYAELIAAAKSWEAPPKTPPKDAQAQGDEPWREGGHLPRTDLGNCQRLVAQHGPDLRCVAAVGWVEWDGRVWVRSEAAPHQRARQTVRALYVEAADEPDTRLRADLAAWARSSESATRMAAIVALASHDRVIVAQVEDFDRDPWSFNCLNGTVDLRTGTLAPHRREDLITLMAPVEYDPGARFDRWGEFLAEATRDDLDLQSYLQRCAGYTLTGEVSHDEFYVLHGPGGTGKTTFIEALMGMMGPYAGGLRTEAVLQGASTGGHNEDIARLVGKRLVVLEEASEREQLREGLIKQLTGGGRISASFKGKPGFDFHPVLKLWVATNHVPKMPEGDSGMERRFRKLPFEHKPSKLDTALRHLLRTDPQARAAVLAWAVEGCLAWQKEGLNAPASVDAASKRVFEGQAVLGEFFEDCLEFGGEFEATAAEIRAAYEEYAEVEKIPLRSRVSAKRLSDSLKTHGCEPGKGTGGTRLWKGVRVTRPGPNGASGASGAENAFPVEPLTRAREGSSTESGKTAPLAPLAGQDPADLSSNGASGFPSRRPDGAPKGQERPGAALDEHGLPTMAMLSPGGPQVADGIAPALAPGGGRQCDHCRRVGPTLRAESLEYCEACWAAKAGGGA